MGLIYGNHLKNDKTYTNNGYNAYIYIHLWMAIVSVCINNIYTSLNLCPTPYIYMHNYIHIYIY